MRCDAVRISLNALEMPGDLEERSQEAMGYILTLLVSVSARQEFVEVLVREQHILLPAMHHQAIGRREERSGMSMSGREGSSSSKSGSATSYDSHTEIVSALAHNLSLLREFTASISLVPALSEMFVNTLKALYRADRTRHGEIRVLALTSMCNLALNNRSCRACVLGGDVKSEGGKALGVASEDFIEVHRTSLHCTKLYCAALIILYCTILHSYCIVLYCLVL